MHQSRLMGLLKHNSLDLSFKVYDKQTSGQGGDSPAGVEFSHDSNAVRSWIKLWESLTYVNSSK